MDSVLASGALAALLCFGACWRSAALRRCSQLLLQYAGRAGTTHHWWEVSLADAACAAGPWLAAVLLRLGQALLHPELALLHVGGFALSAAVLVGASAYLIHACRCVLKLSDSFCYDLVEQPDFAEVLWEWSLLQSLIRGVSKSVQFGYVALQAAMTAVVLLSVTQVSHLGIATAAGAASGLVVALEVARTSVWAAAITDKCARIPSLVNSISVGKIIDHDRMYCVQHIAHSQAGFYIFELRLTSAAIVKTIYIACAMAFGFATQIL
uniref:Uncharacterized protein n=1 Tax=Alexandrium catenella TaxID=2925 RepID=A0A7S1WD34_ALECA